MESTNAITIILWKRLKQILADILFFLETYKTLMRIGNSFIISEY